MYVFCESFPERKNTNPFHFSAYERKHQMPQAVKNPAGQMVRGKEKEKRQDFPACPAGIRVQAIGFPGFFKVWKTGISVAKILF